MSLMRKLFSRNFFVFNLVALGAIFGFALAFFSFTLGSKSAQNVVHAEEPASTTMSTEALSAAENMQAAFRAVSAKVLPSVVEVNVVEVKTQQVPQFDGIPWEYFFGTPDQNNGNKGNAQPRQYKSQGLGSGVIVRRSGSTYYVLTNNHVAGSATEISITMQDGRNFPAKLVGKDERKDLALVSFESKGESFPVAVLGNSDSVKVGDWAIAVGNPLGLISSVTAGIISAVGRTGGPAGNINDFIQTDAAINQGNSGGALVNIRGEVVGINTWIASPSGGSVGLGFAIPINNAKRAIDDFISSGEVKYGWLGVSLTDSDETLAKDFKLVGKKGAFVAQLFLGSPADKGGLLPGDFIIALDGQPVKSRDQLVLLVGDLPAGKKATFTVIRDGVQKDVVVKIEERKSEVDTNYAKLWPGVIVVGLTDDVRSAANLDASAKGVLAASVVAKSPADMVGLRNGDLIVGVNGETVNSVADFYKVMNEKAQKDLWFEVSRAGQTLESMRFRR